MFKRNAGSTREVSMAWHNTLQPNPAPLDQLLLVERFEDQTEWSHSWFEPPNPRFPRPQCSKKMEKNLTVLRKKEESRYAQYSRYYTRVGHALLGCSATLETKPKD